MFKFLYIIASILSKKKIEDIQILLMDIKFGKGTFMKTEEDANRLAEAMVVLFYCKILM